MLTSHQSGALAFLDDYMATCRRNESSFAALKGYAGVGKTWLVAYWVERLLERNPRLRIIIVAPTNKAVDVLRAKCGHLDVQFRTLDSYLGFKVKRNDDWQMERRRNAKAADDEPVDLVICDEGSMVKQEYHDELKWKRVPVLYVLDPAQLEPVKEVAMPAALVEPCFMMTEVVRQAAGNPIIELATYLRDRVNDNQTFILQDVRQFAREDDRRIAFTNTRNVLQWASTALDKGMDARILAFTNVAVNEYNAKMHALRFPGVPCFGEGELALVNEAFEYDDETLLCNGELLRVVACEPAEPIAEVEVYTVRALRLASSLEVDGETKGEELTMLVARDPDHAFRRHRELTDRIYELRKLGKMGDADELMKVRRPLNKLAPLRHAYACTVHKSQGSTYDVAFIDFADIYRSREMRARLLYVAATRPSEFLVIAHGGH